MMAIQTTNVTQSQMGTGSRPDSVVSAAFPAVAAAVGGAFAASAAASGAAGACDDSAEGSLTPDSSCSAGGAPMRPVDASLSGSGAAMRPPASISPAVLASTSGAVAMR